MDSAGGEVLLDFSSVRRIVPNVLTVMEEFVGIADNKGVKVVLRGVNVDVYRVFKLVKLASRFSFVN
jgi:anti-anti-sigma regulatory factor